MAGFSFPDRSAVLHVPRPRGRGAIPGGRGHPLVSTDLTSAAGSQRPGDDNLLFGCRHFVAACALLVDIMLCRTSRSAAFPQGGKHAHAAGLFPRRAIQAITSAATFMLTAGSLRGPVLFSPGVSATVRSATASRPARRENSNRIRGRLCPDQPNDTDQRRHVRGLLAGGADPRRNHFEFYPVFSKANLVRSAYVPLWLGYFVPLPLFRGLTPPREFALGALILLLLDVNTSTGDTDDELDPLIVPLSTRLPQTVVHPPPGVTWTSPAKTSSSKFHFTVSNDLPTSHSHPKSMVVDGDRIFFFPGGSPPPRNFFWLAWTPPSSAGTPYVQLRSGR